MSEEPQDNVSNSCLTNFIVERKPESTMTEKPSTMERQFKISLEQQDNATINCLTQDIDDKKQQSGSSKNPSGSLNAI